MNFTPYNQSSISSIQISDNKSIASFITSEDVNLDKDTVDAFGEEWLKFNAFTDDEIRIAGSQYFDIVDDSILNKNTTVLDLGCGSGRWTKFIADKVKLVEAIDPSQAVFSAYQTNIKESNVRITQASVSNIPFEDSTFDLVICLGVLHHIPDTQQALIDVVKKLKKGGSILLYLYYSLDNRGIMYKLLFQASSILRLLISKLPKTLKKIICDAIAIFIYMPFVLITRLLQSIFKNKNWIKKIPLSYYTDKSFNIIRNDALDRFGTPLEQRFSKEEITTMMEKAGLSKLNFSNNEPYWHMSGVKI
jgi:ubiquinone/menaquinone biosynthesis C-methylase UbiE